MIEYLAAITAAVIGGGLAYGDLRAKIGKLEGKIDLISKNIVVILNNNHKK